MPKFKVKAYEEVYYEGEIEEWKEGRVRLWDSIYSFKVYEYEAKPVNFEEKKNA